jgi:hypothetical protein
MTVALNDLLVGPVTPTVGTTLISLDFYFENASDLEVYKSGSNTPLTITTDYTVSLPSGGTRPTARSRSSHRPTGRIDIRST